MVPWLDLLLIDIWIQPEPHPFHIIDLPLSGQIYLGKKRLKAYGNFGLINSLSIYNNSDYKNYIGTGDHLGKRSLSFRYMFGMGLNYQFGKHIGIDLAVNRKKRLLTFEDHYIRPRDVNYSFQTTINYIF